MRAFVRQIAANSTPNAASWRCSFERQLATVEKLESFCATSVGVLPGVMVEELWHAIAKYYRERVPFLIVELARKCSREGATLVEAADALREELNRGRVRWRRRLLSPTIPTDLDDIKKIAFMLLRIEAQRVKRLPLSRTQLIRILGPHFPSR
jgi:hypothetical protein